WLASPTRALAVHPALPFLRGAPVMGMANFGDQLAVALFQGGLALLDPDAIARALATGTLAEVSGGESEPNEPALADAEVIVAVFEDSVKSNQDSRQDAIDVIRRVANLVVDEVALAWCDPAYNSVIVRTRDLPRVLDVIQGALQ